MALRESLGAAAALAMTLGGTACNRDDKGSQAEQVDSCTLYVDADGDGFGDATAQTTDCTDTQAVKNATDCDDTNANISPEAKEVCDAEGIDEDCNAETSATGAVLVRTGETADEIQELLDKTEEGDTVLVCEGEYGHIKVSTNGVTVQSLDGADSTIIRGDDLEGENHSAVRIDKDGDNATIDGFTITGGAGEEDEYQVNPAGGGIGIEGDDVVIKNSIIKGNRVNQRTGVGGGLYIEGDGATLENLEITDNSAGNGGGAFIFNNRREIGVTLNDVQISENDAPLGGGALLADVEGIATNLIVSENTATHAAGLYVEGTASVTLNDTSIQGNVAEDQGGGIYIYGDDDLGNPTVNANNVTISGNEAVGGGGVFLISGSIEAEDLTVSGNKADYGAAAYVGCAGSIVGEGEGSIDSNKASESGSAIYAGGDAGTEADCSAGLTLAGFSISENEGKTATVSVTGMDVNARHLDVTGNTVTEDTLFGATVISLSPMLEDLEDGTSGVMKKVIDLYDVVFRDNTIEEISPEGECSKATIDSVLGAVGEDGTVSLNLNTINFSDVVPGPTTNQDGLECRGLNYAGFGYTNEQVATMAYCEEGLCYGYTMTMTDTPLSTHGETNDKAPIRVPFDATSGKRLWR